MVPMAKLSLTCLGFIEFAEFRRYSGWMFVRFVSPEVVPGMAFRQGFFVPAYEMRGDDEVDPYTKEQLEDILAWFRQNLIIPDRFSRKDADLDEDDTLGLSWFKDSAKEHVSKSYELIALLELYGYMIDTLRTERPGYIVYEDDHQVVAEPFRDTPR